MTTKFVFFLLLIPLFFLTSCVDEVNLAHETKATYFYLSSTDAYSYANIEFVIDTVADEDGFYNITNPYKEYPYGVMNDSLTANFYYEGSYGMYVHFSEGDTFYQTNSFQHIFKQSVFITVVPEDGNISEAKEYRLSVRYKMLNPNELVWANYSTPASFATDWYKKGFAFAGKNWVLTGNIDTDAGTVSNSLYIKDGSQLIPQSLPSSFPSGIQHSLVVFNNKIHIYGYVGLDATTNTYIAKQEHWSSDDGLNWVKQDDYPAIGDGVVLSNVIVFKDQLWLYGGSQINEGQTNLEMAYYNTKAVTKSVFMTSRALTDFGLGYNLLDEAVAIYDTIFIPQDTIAKFNLLVRDGMPGPSQQLFNSEDGDNFTLVGTMRPDMAVRFAAITAYSNTFLSFGGELADGTVSSTGLFSEDMLYYVSDAAVTGKFINGSALKYGDFIFNYGGESERYYRGFMESVDGVSWGKSPSIRKPLLDEKCAGASSWLDDDKHSVIVIGGYTHQEVLKDGVKTAKRVSVDYMKEGVLNSFID